MPDNKAYNKTSQVDYAVVSLRDDLYRDDATHALGGLFDIAVNVYGLSDELAQQAFIASGIARQFERHNPVFISGKSSLELAIEVVRYAGIDSDIDAVQRFGRSEDWWAGWVLAWYQFDTGAQYQQIFEKVPYSEVKSMYYPLHEAPESKFGAELRRLLASRSQESRLKLQREAAGYSQSQLAESAGVGLRAIQMYEQRRKDINKAQALTLVRLANALHCKTSDLLELA